MDFLDNRLHFLLLCQDCVDNTILGFTVGNQIADTDTERTRLHVFGYNILHVVDVFSCTHIAVIVANAVNYTLCSRTQHGLLDLSADILAGANLQYIV